VLDAMPYIIVNSTLNPGDPSCFGAVTYIECEQETLQQHLQAAMASLPATRFGQPLYPSFEITMPPYVVLNRLRSQAGFRVVAANSSGNATSGYVQIWTLSNTD